MSDRTRAAGADEADEPPDDTKRSTKGLMEVPVARSLAGQDIIEYVIPPDTPVARRVDEATIQLRRWTVAGLGILTGLVILLAGLIVLIRPELAEFVRNFSAIALAGLFGFGGPVVGFLFARETDR
jgi:hypothetical protein